MGRVDGATTTGTPVAITTRQPGTHGPRGRTNRGKYTLVMTPPLATRLSLAADTAWQRRSTGRDRRVRIRVGKLVRRIFASAPSRR